MSQPPAQPTPPSPAGILRTLCETYVSGEEMALNRTVSSVRAIRATLLKGGIEELERSLQLQQEGAAVAAVWRRQRDQFRQDAAACLGMPAESITLGRLLEHLPPGDAEPIRRARQRLRTLAAQVEQLNRGNRILMRYTLDFFQQFFVGLTGGRGSGIYARSGKQQPAACHSLMQARG